MDKQYSSIDLTQYMTELELTVKKYYRINKLLAALFAIIALFLLNIRAGFLLSVSVLSLFYLLCTRPKPNKTAEYYMLETISCIIVCSLIFQSDLLNILDSWVFALIIFGIVFFPVVMLVSTLMNMESKDQLRERAVAIMDYCLMMVKYGGEVEIARVLTSINILNYDLYNEFHYYFQDIEPKKLKRMVCEKVYRE